VNDGAELSNSVQRHIQETADNSVADKVDVREKHATLKKVLKDLKQSYSSLKQMTEQRMIQPQQQLSFVDSRVRELWMLAKQANMTDDQLASFKVRYVVLYV